VIADGVARFPGPVCTSLQVDSSCGTLNGLKVIGSQKDQMPRVSPLNDTAYSLSAGHRGMRINHGSDHLSFSKILVEYIRASLTTICKRYTAARCGLRLTGNQKYPRSTINSSLVIFRKSPDNLGGSLNQSNCGFRIVDAQRTVSPRLGSGPLPIMLVMKSSAS